MNKVYLSSTCIILAITLLTTQSFAKPNRLERSQSFLGVHFDFHAGKDCNEIGKNVDREMIAYIIDNIQPDYVQCDCKGHRGFSSYPTKVGNPAPGFVKDPLKIWREVTAERGVALYMHYSGVWDAAAVKKHPEWARINEKGKPDNRLTSVYGPYVDKLLIPQLKELCDEYQVDGVWVDGECWAIERDYGKEVIKEFKNTTGFEKIPYKPKDKNWFEYSEFCRQGFRNYLEHYITQMHEHNPDFQIASNWAYSSMMPEPVNIDVDFISGDFSAMNSVNTARIEGRSMVYQGKPWDLMAWSFTWTDGRYSTKSVKQLQQEAAMVLALGGGFQAYFPQKRDGSIRRWQIDLMKQVAEFCRQRQEYCHQAEPIPQIGLIYSGKAFYRRCKKLFAAWHGELVPMRGILQSLLESQNVVDVVMEHHLTDRMNEYPLLVYPEWEYIDPEFKQKLLTYVEQGGHLLVIGPRAVKLFESELNIQTGEMTEQVNGLEYNGWIAGIKSEFAKVRLQPNTETMGRIYKDNDMDGPYETAASIHSYGKGKIAAVYLNLGERYHNAATSVSRSFLNAIAKNLFPDPIVSVVGSQYTDVTLMRKNGRMMVNLCNTAGPHGNDKIYVYDDFPSIGPLGITIHTKQRPQKVTLQPENQELEYTYANHQIQLVIPSLDIHNVIVVE